MLTSILVMCTMLFWFIVPPKHFRSSGDENQEVCGSGGGAIFGIGHSSVRWLCGCESIHRWREKPPQNSHDGYSTIPPG